MNEKDVKHTLKMIAEYSTSKEEILFHLKDLQGRAYKQGQQDIIKEINDWCGNYDNIQPLIKHLKEKFLKEDK